LFAVRTEYRNMKDRVTTLLVATIAALLVAIVNPLSLPNTPVKQHSDASISRRSALLTVGGMLTGGSFLNPPSAWAAPDCFKDCLKNCKLIAPKDPVYCKDTCDEYCAQEDRADGLSGSTSATSGEVGILGGTFGQGTVPKGEDKVSNLI
jgi:hypothetical protein